MRILTALVVGTLVGGLGAGGVVALAGEAQVAAPAGPAAATTCVDGPGDGHEAEGMWFGSTRLAAL